jgi:hypothetical protein
MANDFESLPEAVKTALQRGRQLDAIKLLRQATGISLKAAKERIEGIVAQGVPLASSQQPQQASSATGTATPAELGPLAPGEQPRSGGSRLVALLVVAVAAVAAVLLNKRP